MARTRVDHLKGTKWSKLTFNGETEFRTDSDGKLRLWGKFNCECGNNERWYVFTRVKRGVTKSCGCLRLKHNPRAWTKGRFPKEVSFKALYKRYRTNARSRGIVFLPYEEWRKVVVLDCYYCGASPSSYNVFNEPSRRRSWKGSAEEMPQYEIFVNGVDRYEPLPTYIANSVPCCATCNVMKGQLTPDAFREHLQKILSNGFQGVSLRGLHDPAPATGHMEVRVCR